MPSRDRIVLGIDPGLANTGWGIVAQRGARLSCVAYGCISTDASMPLAQRLRMIHEQMGAVIERFDPTCVGIETVWFGQNITAAFATGQARGAALVACAESDLDVGEFTPRQIKLAVVGTGSAEKEQVQYMVRKLLALDHDPRPDHASDALAAAICYTTHEGPGRVTALGISGARAEVPGSNGMRAGMPGGSDAKGLEALVAKAIARDEARAASRRAVTQARGAVPSRMTSDGLVTASDGFSAAREELLSKVRKG